jgi:uncharacterized OsmC-like protein
MSDTEVVTTRLADRHGVHWEARDLSGRTDRPGALGGGNAGLMASEHLLVALASCTTTSAYKIGEKRGVHLDDVRCRAEMDFDERGLASAIRLRIEVESPSDEKDVAKVFDLAERVCTISKLLVLAPERTLVHEKK